MKRTLYEHQITNNLITRLISLAKFDYKVDLIS